MSEKVLQFAGDFERQLWSSVYSRLIATDAAMAAMIVDGTHDAIATHADEAVRRFRARDQDQRQEQLCIMGLCDLECGANNHYGRFEPAKRPLAPHVPMCHVEGCPNATCLRDDEGRPRCSDCEDEAKAE